MVKQECFVCDKNIGKFTFTYHEKDLFDLRIIPPNNFDKSHCICEACVDQMKKQKEEEEIVKKPECVERAEQLISKIPDYKMRWDKTGIIQFKNERMAVLNRIWGRQVEFIIAYDELTNEGYQLMAVDDGRVPSSEGISTGLNSYFYFQKIDTAR